MVCPSGLHTGLVSLAGSAVRQRAIALAGGSDMNGDLKLTAAGANLIKHFEGCHKRVGPDRYQAYVCPAGVLTIGFGITRADKYKFGPNTIWSMADCDEAFVDSMREYEAAVHRMVTVALQPWQYDALVSFCFNCGPGNLQKSTLLILLRTSAVLAPGKKRPSRSHDARRFAQPVAWSEPDLKVG
jgi:GH24 family phage-related lysozyme (muramidase)